MNEEILRQKYIYLRYNLYNIRNKVNNLISIHDDTYNDLLNFILIDNKIIDEAVFDSLKNSEKYILSELNNIVIPNINNKV